MRIMIDGRMILPYMTGVGRYLLGLIPALRDSCPDLDIELILQNSLHPDYPIWNLEGDRLCLFRVPTKQMTAHGQLLVPKLLASSHPDLFHYPHFDLPWLVAGPIVSTIHDLKYIAHPNFFPHQASLRRLAIRLSTILTCRRSRLMIVVSQYTAQDLTNYLSISKSRIRIIPHGVDPRFYHPLPPSFINQIRHRYNLNLPYLLFVGERRPHKNLVGLIEAYAIFRRLVSQSYLLVIVGKPYSDYHVPEQMVQEKNLVNHVRFIDYLQEEDLPAVYRGAEAFLLLSFYEGFGLPVLEAMASGVPVVASNCTSLPEVVGDAAILVSPDDPEQASHALRQVIPGGELRESCIASGLERARMFTWERCARLTFSVYQEALAS